MHIFDLSQFSYRIQHITMSLLNYFQPSKELPTMEQTGLPARVLREANEVVKEALSATNVPKKKKYTTAFTAEDRAAIGRYASENGNAAAVKKFRAMHNVERAPFGLSRRSTSRNLSGK